MKTRTGIYVMLAALVLGMAPAVGYGALAAHGPINPNNGGPLWVQDSNGLSLELNLDFVNGLSMPPVAGNAFSQQIGFGDEGFYYSCDALIDLANGQAPGTAGLAILVQAVEFAFLPGPAPAQGEQFVFQRIRIRVDCPVAGTYTVTYPYGQKTYNVTTPGRRAINETIDLGGPPPTFLGLLTGAIGPFCVPDPSNAANFTAPNLPVPAGLIGTVLSNVTIVGSPFGTNFFRVAGPVGSNLGGPGINTVTSPLFNVTGKVFPGNPLTLQAVLSADQVVPAAISNALGVVDLNVNAGQTTLSFTANLLPLPTSAVQKIEVRLGAVGATAGPVLFTLFDSAVNGVFTSPRAVVLTTADFTPPADPLASPPTFADALTAILSGEASVVVSTADNPAGEIRGQLLTAGAPVPVVGARATLTAAAGGAGTLDVFAAAVPGATTTVTVGAAPAVPLVNNGQTLAFAQIPVANAATLPATVTVRSTRPGSADTLVIVSVADAVTIGLARFQTGVNILDITAASSDLFSNPVLTAEGYGVIAGGTLSVSNVLAPPSSVTVSSARGGKAILPVAITGPLVTAAPAPTAPVGVAPTLPNPPALTWAAAANATSYDVEIFGGAAATVAATTFTPAAALPVSQPQSWRVRGTNVSGVGPWSAWTAFTISSPPAVTAAPVPAAPAGTVPNLPNPPAVSWAAVANATNYDVEIFGGASGTVATTTFTAPGALPVGQQQSWRVRGTNATSLGPWSAWTTFTVATPPLVTAAPVATSPSGAVPNLPNPPALVWATAVNATSYDVEILNGATSTVTTTTWTPPAALATGQQQFWRVRGTTAFGIGPWSAWNAFTVADAGPVTAAPTAQTPGGTLPNQPNSPHFTWTAAARAIDYDVEIFGDKVYAIGANVTAFDLPTPVLTGGQRFWRVRGKNSLGAGPWSAFKTFSITAQAVGAARPIGPTGGQNNQPNPPQFTWTAAAGATSYDVDIYQGAVYTAAGTTFTPPAPILTGKAVFWRVRGRNGGDAGPWSAYANFTIRPLQISAPKALGPKGNLPRQPNPPQFTWTASANATSYEVDIYGDAVYPVVGTTFTPATPLAAGLKFWRVRARNGGDASGWSSYQSFVMAP